MQNKLPTTQIDAIKEVRRRTSPLLRVLLPWNAMKKMPTEFSVLVLENSPSDAAELAYYLERAGFGERLVWATSKETFLAALEKHPDVIVADCDLTGFGARAALCLLQERGDDTPVIVRSRSVSDHAAIECLKSGAVDHVPKDRLERLGPALVWAHMDRQLRVARARAARLQGVWETSGDAMRLTNPEGTIMAVNPAFCELVSMREEELVGKPLTVALDSSYDPAAVLKAHLRRFQEDDRLVGREWRLRFRNGKEIDAELTIVRIGVQCGEELMLTMIRDISEKKAMEANFLRSQRLESIGALAGGVAHDFNNILAPIFMASSMLRMQLNRDDFERTVKTIEDSAQRGSDVVRRLLSFARGIEGDRIPTNPEVLVQEVARIVEQSFPRNIRLKSSTGPDVHPVAVDRTQIHQVLLNLCVNARDAMPDGGVISVGVKNVTIKSDKLPRSAEARSGSFVVLSVGDTGLGMSPEVEERIFEPFFSTKAPLGGSGLGLSTSLGIVRSHGGFIAVTTELGRGSRFDVFLPVSSLPAVPEEEKDPSDDSGAGEGEVILVVDDEDAVRRVACKLLNRCGYHAVGVGTARAGLDVLGKRKDIALILTDLSMPKMNGIQFLREVRRSKRSLPAIAMSGNLDQRVLQELSQLGVAQVVEKPFNAQKLLDAIQKVRA